MADVTWCEPMGETLITVVHAPFEVWSRPDETMLREKLREALAELAGDSIFEDVASGRSSPDCLADALAPILADKMAYRVQ